MRTATRRLYPALLSALCLAAAAPAQKAPLDPWTVVSLRQVSEAIALPGGEAAYVLSQPRTAEEPDGSAHRVLHHWSGPGQEPRVLLGAEAGARALAPHPAGGAVTVLARGPKEKVSRVWSIPLGTEGKPRALSPAGVSVRAYALSPDGGTLAYTVRAPLAEGREAERKRGFDRIVYEEELRQVELYVMRLEGGEPRPAEAPGTVHALTWADAGTLIFSAAPTPLIDDRYMARDLFALRMNPDPGEPAGRLLVDLPGKMGGFTASPNGKHVAYVAGRDAKDPKESSLYVVGAEGGWPAGLTPLGYEGHVVQVAWLDDDTLLGLSVEGCKTRLWLQPARGGSPTTVVSPGEVALRSFHLDRESGKVVLVGDTAVHPRELFTLDLKTHRNAPDAAPVSPVRVTRSNPGLGNFAMGRQEVIRYRAKDGLEIEGLVIFPTDWDDRDLEEEAGSEERKRYPLICVIHGGPESQYLDGWVTRYATPGQMVASRGYLQFYPNYRSSTGRGVAFSRAGQGDAAGAEFEDVVDGVDYLVELGWADPERVGITGGSYGGYFTAWGATRYSHRFRAGVMFVGISNQLSKIGTTDIPQESYLSHWGVRPWERPDLYLERSPILYTDDADTALLILHGQEDPRVSPTQSKELHRWLKLRGRAPVRLVLYPGEGHGNRRRASQLDYALRMLRWWDHYLKGDGRELPPPGISYEKP